MRLIGVALALVIATGCTSNQVNFEHRSNLQTQTRGIALLDDRDSAQAGMAGNTCEVEMSSGMIGADTDVAVGEDDNVQDAVGSSTVVVGGAGVYVMDADFWGGWGEPDVRLSDVAEARLIDDGVATLSGDGDCQVQWHGTGDASVGVDVGDCTGAGFAVDRTTGRAFVATGTGLVLADPAGDSQTVDGEFDLVAYDGASDAVYTAQSGGTEIRAHETDGSLRWAAQLAAPITSIDDMGPLGAVAVMTGDNGAGLLVVLDGMTGEQLSDVPTPSAAPRIMVGNNGESMAMVLENETHFFAVDLAAQ